MKNKYSIKGDIVEIHLTQGRKTIISVEDFDKVNSHEGTWGAYTHNKYTYVQTRKPGTRSHIKLARFIMNAPPDTIVDHINRDTLDNRRKNLRITTLRQNRYNSKLSQNNTSGHVGVIRTQAKTPSWRAQIWNNGKNIPLGTYRNIEDAIKARKEAEEKYYK